MIDDEKSQTEDAEFTEAEITKLNEKYDIAVNGSARDDFEDVSGSQAISRRVGVSSDRFWGFCFIVV